MRNYPFEIISSTSSVTKAFAIDNSIINVRNVDTVPPTEIALHSHPYYSIVYVDSCDTFTTYIDGCAINYQPGNVYFNPPGTLHSPKNQFRGMLSSISLKLYITDVSLAEALGNVPFHSLCDKNLIGYFRETVRIHESADTAMYDELYELTDKILTSVLSLPKSFITLNSKNSYDLCFINVLKFMYAHCDRDIDLGELASTAHMERTAFAKKFKSLYKITPINYLYSIRLSRSLDLLMSFDLPITKIARMVGFKRATAFTAAFTRTFEMTPTEYRDALFKCRFPSIIRKRV